MGWMGWGRNGIREIGRVYISKIKKSERNLDWTTLVDFGFPKENCFGC